MAIVRRFALGLVRANKAKGSVKTRRKTASWNPDFLLQVLQIGPLALAHIRSSGFRAARGSPPDTAARQLAEKISYVLANIRAAAPVLALDKARTRRRCSMPSGPEWTCCSRGEPKRAGAQRPAGRGRARGRGSW